MAWQDRLRPTIEFTSPLKKRFSAFWREDDVEGSHSLGREKYPNIKGAFIQDMDVGDFSYPLNFFFEGGDHDLLARNFLEACKERGEWRIVHPMLGDKTLYLESFRATFSATENANISSFSTLFFESIIREEILSKISSPQFVNTRSEEILNEDADEYAENITQETETQKQAVRVAGRSLLTRIRGALAALYELNNQINARVNAIQSAINSALDEFILRPLALAAQFQQLITLPALAINNIERRLESYRALAESIFGLTPETTFPRDKNIAATMSMTLGATLAASAQSLVTGPLPTRRAAIENAESLLDLFNFVTDGLGDIEALFSGLQADQQFLAQTRTFADYSSLISQAADAAIKQSFDLAIEKRFILETPRTPIDIVAEEYKDFNQLDLFNESNALQGDELILLPAGKEVVVYV